MERSQVWNAGHYDERLGFVSKLGAGVVELLNPRPGERVLDVGCGTGDLTKKLADEGCRVEGIDRSREMIDQARVKYPELSFRVEDAEEPASYPKECFDAVFSNAALHWMKQPSRVLEGVWSSLKPGGRFAAEFGGRGNVAGIYKAVEDALISFGIRAEERNPWYFPSLGEYACLLESHGFHVEVAVHFARPTPLNGGGKGLEHWLEMFAGPFFEGMMPAEKKKVYRLIEEIARPSLYREETSGWEGDYVRLRLLAVKPR
ncbi:class I SAM-dependent methyltransferase [Paenibacillus aurantius]|uniref:Class I SAM-dependent methyltransferase n=1 Tax=Paenibacillus aurantius TaxID=2918900 RepID=A0AA96LAF1_9BACL|nr:class I SAM-dependent methyltransferase [Paenibacillus aurantius]WNQ10134.1 class I SAM-dependent methyltransferase [Paenibacillus aurantius]